MKVNQALTRFTSMLQAAGIATARLDSLVLLEDVLNTNRTQFLAEPDHILTDVDIQKLEQLIAKRAQHIPLAFVRGKTEFYGLEFIISRHVLEPRPESETMIDLLLSLSTARDNQSLQIIDIGTGSGALAVTAKLELPRAEVVATDIDPACLKVARANANKHGAHITFLQGDLCRPLRTLSSKHSAVALLCNLPYVPDEFKINRAAMHEPKQAIFGGPDGLDYYRRLFDQLAAGDAEASHVFTESMPPQHTALVEIAQKAGYRQEQSEDFIQLFARAN